MVQEAGWEPVMIWHYNDFSRSRLQDCSAAASGTETCVYTPDTLRQARNILAVYAMQKVQEDQRFHEELVVGSVSVWTVARMLPQY